MRVLALGAHPDDLEVLCAGTLAKYSRAGHHVVMCNASMGDLGASEAGVQNLPETRLEEARRAAEIIGADHMTLSWRDNEINGSAPEQKRQVVELIRSTSPDLLITLDPNDYQDDHREIARLAWNATLFAALPMLETGSPAKLPIPRVYYCDPVYGLGSQPSSFVDISDVIDVKERALRQHESQLGFMDQLGASDLVEGMLTTARFRGFQSGVRYAEGFTPALSALRVGAVDLLP